MNTLVFRGVPSLLPTNTTMRTQLFYPFFLLFGALCAAQELVGPDRTLPGTLASFEIVPEQEASWHIVSPTHAVGTYQIDRGLTKLYFASPEPGRYTVIAGIVVDGKPELLVKTFINGEGEIGPFPVPIPLPPVTSLETWVKTQLPVLVKSENLTSESRLVAECFEEIVQRIESENIRTVQNARAQLQITLTGTLALASPTAVTDWMPFISELSRQMEKELGDTITDLATMKKTFQDVANAVKSLELPETISVLRTPVQDTPMQDTPVQDIDPPNLRTPGTQNRVFRNVLAR